MRKILAMAALCVVAMSALVSKAADIWEEGDEGKYYWYAETDLLKEGEYRVYPYPEGSYMYNCDFFYYPTTKGIYIAGIPWGCVSKENLCIPAMIGGKKVIAITEGAFRSCQFDTVSFEENSEMLQIDWEAFGCCTIGTLDLSNCSKLTWVGENAIDYSECERIILPNVTKDLRGKNELFFACLAKGVQSIEIANWTSACAYKLDDNGFLYDKTGTELICVPNGKSVATVDIPEGVTKLGLGVFFNATVSAVNFPSTLKTIGAFAFASDTDASIRIIDTSKNKNFVVENGLLLDAAKKRVYWVAVDKEDVVIPSGVTSYDCTIFNGHENLRSIYFPNTVTSIMVYGAPYKGSLDDADCMNIRGCRNLERIYIEPGNKMLKEVDGNIWTVDNKCSIWINFNRGDIVIPDGNKVADLWMLQDFDEMRDEHGAIYIFCPSSLSTFGYDGEYGAIIYAEGVTPITFEDAWSSGYEVHIRTDANLAAWQQELKRDGYAWYNDRDDEWYYSIELIQDIEPSQAIMLDTCGGELPSNASEELNKELGATYGTLPTPTRFEGGLAYRFEGWFTRPDGEGGDKITSTTIVRMHHAILYAHWVLQPVKVTFDPNGGTPKATTAEYEFGSEVMVPAMPTRAGYKFAGWWTAKTGGEMVSSGIDGEIVPAIANAPKYAVTYYAQWLKAYTLKVVNGSAIWHDDALDKDFEGSSISVLQNGEAEICAAEREGHDFTHWTINPANAKLGEGFDVKSPMNTIVMPAANVTLTANYLKRPGHISLNVRMVDATGRDVSGIYNSQPQNILYSVDGKNYFDLTRIVEDIKVAAGKYTLSFKLKNAAMGVEMLPKNITGTINPDDEVSFDIAVVVNRSVSALATEGGTVGADNKGLLQSGKAVNVTAKVNKGYALVGWRYLDAHFANGTYERSTNPKFTMTADVVDTVMKSATEGDRMAYKVEAVFVPTALCEMPKEIGFFSREDGAVKLYAGVVLSYERDLLKLDVAPFDAHCPVTYTAKTLPAGLVLDKYSGAITGVPTKPGVYQVEFAATSSVNSKMVAKKIYKFRIEALPNSLVGNLNGDVEVSGDGFESWGMATLTIGSTGKITGAIPVNGKNMTLAATSLTDIDVYDGTDAEDGLSYRGTARAIGTATYGKSKCNFELAVSFEEVYSKTRDASGRQYLLKGAALTGLRFWGLEEAVPTEAITIWTDANDNHVDYIPIVDGSIEYICLGRNVGKDDGVVAALGSLAGTYTEESDWGSCALTINKNGTLQLKFVLPDGTKASGSMNFMNCDDDIKGGNILNRDDPENFYGALMLVNKNWMVGTFLNFVDGDGHPYIEIDAHNVKNSELNDETEVGISGIDLGVENK